MTQFVLAIIISIAVLVFLIVKLNVHPVISLFVGGMLCGSILGNSPLTTITTIANGFGSTLGSIGMTIIFGSIIACSIRDSGAAKSMVNFFIKLFRGKNLELSTGMAAYIMSIPVFGDVTMVLISPLCAIISKRQNKPMGQMAAFTVLALNLTHSMVPPTPGILAVAVLLGADLGLVILWGIVCSFIAYIITWILMRKWAGKDYYPPKPEFVEGVEEVKSNDYHDLLIKEENLPNVLFAMSPILVPVILIALASFADMTMAEGAMARVVLDTLGNRNIAMFLGMVFGWLLAVTHKEKALANYNQTSGKNEKSLFTMMFNGWVGEALEVALVPLIVTGFGGGFGEYHLAFMMTGNGAMPNAYGHDDAEYLEKLDAMGKATSAEEQASLAEELDQYFPAQHWAILVAGVQPNYDFMSNRIGGYSGEKIYYKGNMRTFWARLWINE